MRALFGIYMINKAWVETIFICDWRPILSIQQPYQRRCQFFFHWIFCPATFLRCLTLSFLYLSHPHHQNFPPHWAHTLPPYHNERPYLFSENTLRLLPTFVWSCIFSSENTLQPYLIFFGPLFFSSLLPPSTILLPPSTILLHPSTS